MKNLGVFASFAVKDLDKAEEFYTKILGLDVTKEAEMGMLEIKSGGGKIMVYPKPDHAPAVFTVFNLVVEDIEKAVDELVGKGVSFDHYDGFNQDAKGIARGDQGPPIAWFKDPSGNIVAVFEIPAK